MPQTQTSGSGFIANVGSGFSGQASDVAADTTNFGGILSATEDEVQAALDALDDHDHSSGTTVDHADLANKGTITHAQIDTRLEETTATTTYYVASTGSDSTGTGISGNPFKTLQHAISLIPKILKHKVTILVQDDLVTSATQVFITGFRYAGDATEFTSGAALAIAGVSTVREIDCSTYAFQIHGNAVRIELARLRPLGDPGNVLVRGNSGPVEFNNIDWKERAGTGTSIGLNVEASIVTCKDCTNNATPVDTGITIGDGGVVLHDGNTWGTTPISIVAGDVGVSFQSGIYTP